MNIYIIKIQCGNCNKINQVAIEYSHQDQFFKCCKCLTPLYKGTQSNKVSMDSNDKDASWMIEECDAYYLPTVKGKPGVVYKNVELDSSKDKNTTEKRCKFCGGETKILFHSERYCPKCRK